MLNIGKIIGKFVKNSSQRELDRLASTVKKINDWESKIKEMPSESFPTKTAELKSKIKNGISLDNLLMRITKDEWEKVIATNLSSAFYLSKAVIRSMLKNRHGRIINIGSVQGSTGAPGHSHYSAAKAGLIGLTKSLAQEVGSRNITVNVISPGYVSTDMTKQIDDKMNQALLETIPLKRFGKPIDIAKTALYLASSLGSYITGETINVNGGMNML